MAIRNLHKTILLICLGLLSSLTGCTSFATDCRKDGFNIITKGFDSIEPTPSLNEVVELNGVKVHIVGDRRFFGWNRAAAYGSPVMGYATSNNEIWLFGKMVNGKIVINQAILGHEFMHLLNFKNPKIANPDKLDDMGI